MVMDATNSTKNTQTCTYEYTCNAWTITRSEQTIQWIHTQIFKLSSGKLNTLNKIGEKTDSLVLWKNCTTTDTSVDVCVCFVCMRVGGPKEFYRPQCWTVEISNGVVTKEKGSIACEASNTSELQHSLVLVVKTNEKPKLMDLVTDLISSVSVY